MNIVSALYTEVIYRPLFNGLVFFYNLTPFADLGIAIFLLTLTVRLLLHPVIIQSIRSQAAMAAIQPKLREVQKRFANDREAQAKATMDLYREAGAHPLAGCVPLLVQLPILLGLFKVFQKGIAAKDFSLLYSFVSAPGAFHPVSLGIFDLTERSVMLAAAAGISQFLQVQLMPAPDSGGGDVARAMAFQTKYVLPIVIAGIAWSLPAAVPFYWTTLNLLAIVQQLWIQKRLAYGRSKGTGALAPRADGDLRAP